MAEKVSRDRGYRCDTIAISRDMGPLRSRLLDSVFLSITSIWGQLELKVARLN